PIADQAQPFGIKRPIFYIPVGQGFIVEIINDLDFIEFNNRQRVFIKESDVLGDQNDPNYAENGSSFYRGQALADEESEIEEDDMQLIRLQFSTSEGATRRFVLGFSNRTTDGFDYGYDGGLVDDIPSEDMGSLFNGKQYVLQAFSPITDDKVIDLNLNASGDLMYRLEIVELNNIDPSREIYLRDNQENIIHDLKDGPYDFTANAGQNPDRFDLVFRNDQTLSNNQEILNDALVFVDQGSKLLFVKRLDEKVKTLTLVNTLGQIVRSENYISNNSLENGISIDKLSTGVYLITIETEKNIKIKKKIVIK
ncbi:MAG: T9SS type A sorting domain-containing protein, partial [Flavobacteriaceae bacterium]|nr:T9SS type A sorting domain-containing protein [Flavobacteriaceae bacterium]